jgi:hypothetical protein
VSISTGLKFSLDRITRRGRVERLNFQRKGGGKDNKKSEDETITGVSRAVSVRKS